MPEPDGSSSSEELIQQYFGKAQSDKVIPLTGFEIKVFMQDAEVAENDHYRISWEKQHKQPYRHDTVESRDAGCLYPL